MLSKDVKELLEDSGYNNNRYSGTLNSLMRLNNPSIMLLILENIAAVEHNNDLLLRCKDRIKQVSKKHVLSSNVDLNLFNSISSLSKKIYLGIISKHDSNSEINNLKNLYYTESKLHIQHHAKAGRLLSVLYQDISLEIASNLSKIQLDDGGWNQFKSNESCIWTTLEITMLMQETKSNIFAENIEKSIAFLESKFLCKSSNILKSKESWNELCIGNKEESMFSGGSLKLMECFSRIERYKKIDRKLMDWLLSIKLSNDLYPRNAMGKQVPDPFVSVRAVSVIDKYSRVKFS